MMTSQPLPGVQVLLGPTASTHQNVFSVLATTYLESVQKLETSLPSVQAMAKTIQPATEDVVFIRRSKKEVKDQSQRGVTVALHITEQSQPTTPRQKPANCRGTVGGPPPFPYASVTRGDPNNPPRSFPTILPPLTYIISILESFRRILA
jgi:hypothetical protein